MQSYRKTGTPTSTSVFLFVMLVLACPMTVYGMSPAGINVKDFGAVGDGKADDTVAIQKAVNAAMKPDGYPAVRIRRNRPHPKHKERFGGFPIPARPEVFFPEGTYRITRPIVFTNYAHIRGAKNSIIRQSDPAKDIFYWHVDLKKYWVQSTHCKVEGLRFEGGKTQLRFWPRNVNATVIAVDDCEFVNAADYPIVCRMYSNPKWTSKRIMEDKENATLKDQRLVYWQPFLVKWKGGMSYLRPNPAKRGKPTFDSTCLRIANCTFDNCMGVVNIGPDMTFIRDCRVTVNPQMDGPIFLLKGSPHLCRVTCVASPAGGKNPYWIQQGGLVSIRNCEFETTTSNGIDFIRDWDENWKTGKKSGPWNIKIVENTKVKVAGSKSNALVWLGKRRQPNAISLIDVTETSGKPVKAIVWESPKDLADLKNFRSTLLNVHPRQLHKILLARNSDNISEALPPTARTLREEPPSKELLAKVTVPELKWKSRDLWSKVQTTLNAADFGVDTDPETDDTAVIQKIFDAVAGKGICEVVFPAGVYLVSEPIRLPSEVLVRGAGFAVFQQTSLEKDIFLAVNAKRLGFRNLLLKDGRYGVDITPAGDADVRVAFTDCWFSDQLVAVRCMTKEKENDAEILIEGGYMNSQQAVVSNANTQAEAVWIFNGTTLENQGSFENHGRMRLKAILGVPSRYKGNKMLANPRWIDNFGRLTSLDFRFGGEGGGFCNVYNRSEDGTVYISGSVAQYKNPAGKKCLLYLEKTPKTAVLHSISTAPWFTGPYRGNSTLLDPKGRKKNARVHISGLTSPDTVD